MQIQIPPRRTRGESIIPMINVVFLLLIFFLLTAQIAPSTPFPLSPPDSRSDIAAEARDVLFISAEGELAWNEARNQAVWPAIATHAPGGPVEIRADGATPAAVLAAHLKQLRMITGHGARLVVSGG